MERYEKVTVDVFRLGVYRQMKAVDVKALEGSSQYKHKVMLVLVHLVDQ